MHTITKTNKKFTKHSSKTKKNESYETLIKELDDCISDKDWESAHIQEDYIFKHFINEIIQNKYKNKKEILTIARMINENVLAKEYTKWYA
jgi:hypothetical protein